MATSLLQDLIARGEGGRTEFKSNVDLEAIGTAVVSFLNASGGTLLVGVDDRGEILGVHEPHKTALGIWRSLTDLLSPSALYSVNVEEIAGKRVIVIDVPSGEDIPYLYGGRIAVRHGTRNLPATAQDISSLIMNRHPSGVRWERLPALGVDMKDLDHPEILGMASEVAQRRLYNWSAPAEPERILEELNLIKDDMPLNGSVVLFARSPARPYPQTRVRVARFASQDQAEFSDNRVLEGHAFTLMEQIDRFLRSAVPIVSSLPTGGFRRKESPAYPWAALREGVVNALVHRDYAAYDGGVSISVLPNRIEIWNSGRLPEGMSIEDLKRGSISRPQNPDIAHVFFLRGFIERVGIGGRRIVTECLEARLPEPTWELRAGGVLLTLRLSHGETQASRAELSLRQLAFLDQTTDGERVTFGDYHQRFASGVSERQARQDLL